ncbi:PIN domain-containing protein [Candidatus Woesearchaeota archaeon]|nr:PIN domain-containing protein [Candidatus Woesearchaeota archaeon]
MLNLNRRFLPLKVTEQPPDKPERLSNFLYCLQQFRDVPIDNETIMNANRFRHSNRKKELSTADAIGYACAKKLGVIFITGDRQFEGMDNALIVR